MAKLMRSSSPKPAKSSGPSMPVAPKRPFMGMGSVHSTETNAQEHKSLVRPDVKVSRNI